MTPPDSKTPQEERGTMLTPTNTLMPLAAIGSSGLELVDDAEHAPEMRWPQGLAVFDKMVRSDGQIKSLMLALEKPLQRRRYEIDPAGADPRDVQLIAEDLGLPVIGSEDPEPVRGRARFNHGEHLAQSLLGLRYGSYWFEIVGEVVEKTWRLRKLAPRPTRTLDSILVDDHGALTGVKQNLRDGRSKVTIPVDHLVGYIHEREGSNWYGVSALRAAYRPFHLKGQALKTDAHLNRVAAGLPTFTPGPDASNETIKAYQRIAGQIVSGNVKGIVLAGPDDKFELVTPKGTLPNALDSARYHDEDIANSLLAMWLKLGQTQSGSRALGETFVETFNAVLDALALWHCDTLNDYLIGKWMRFNHGPDHGRAMPRVVSRRVEAPELAVADLIGMVEKNIIVPDASLRTWIRATYKLPEADDPSDAGVVEAARRTALDDGPASRQRWRELTDAEVRAQIDPEGMDERWRDAVALIVAAWPGVRAKQIDSIVQQIIDADGDLGALAYLSAPVLGREVIEERMTVIAAAAAADARREAAAQGAKLAGRELERTAQIVKHRAEGAAMTLAQSVEFTARRHAMRLTGPGSTPAEVAAGVKEAIESLAESSIAQTVQAPLTAAQNAARAEAMKHGPVPRRIVATEIMDSNTCSACAAIDNTHYATIEEAERDYPGTGFKDCEGMDLCRGFYFAEYDTVADMEGTS